MKKTESEKFVESLIKHWAGPWALLELPNKQWAVAWNQATTDDYADEIAKGNFLVPPFSFIGEEKDAVNYILEELRKDNEREPSNYSWKIEIIRKRLIKSKKASKKNKILESD